MIEVSFTSLGFTCLVIGTVNECNKAVSHRCINLINLHLIYPGGFIIIFTQDSFEVSKFISFCIITVQELLPTSDSRTLAEMEMHTGFSLAGWDLTVPPNYWPPVKQCQDGGLEINC